MSKSKVDAKAAMAWVKSRWSLVAFVVVAVLLVPAMVYFAMGMISTKQADFQKQVEKDAQDFVSPDITYNLRPLIAGEAAISQTNAPNEKIIERYKSAMDRQQASAGGVVEAAIKHNKADHKPLLPNVFPQLNANDLATAKQFRRVYVNDAVKALLDMINAKGAKPPQEVAQELSEFRLNALQNQLGPEAAAGADKLPDDKRAELDRNMLGQRMVIYDRWGQKLQVYATPAIFPNLPVPNEAVTPTPAELWDWQVQYWTMYDIMAAVADANASARDQGVSKSVVKRIERLVIDPVVPTSQPGSPADPSVAAPAAAGDGAPDYARSITGRKTGPLFDVVTANMTCVVDTRNLPRFFDAISKANFMTVTKVRLSKVDLAADLKDGYYYGPKGVTRVELTIEAIWLREWTKELMPKEVKVALGLEAGDPAAPGAAPGASPAPVPAGPAPAGRRAGAAGG